MKIITTLLEFRGTVRRFFQKFHWLTEPVFRFLVAYLTFYTINETLPYNAKLSGIVVEAGLAAVCTFLPQVVLILFGALLATAQIYSASPILAALVLVIFAVLYCFIVRFSGKYGYAIVGVPILFAFKIPYLVPLLLGIVATPIAIFPTACGVIVYYIFRVIQNAALSSNITSLDDTLALYIDVIDQIVAYKEMFLTLAIFSGIILVMYLIRKLWFEYVFEIIIVLGGILNIIGFLLADLYLDIPTDTKEVVFGTLVSVLIVFVAQFFRMVLDYTSVEHIQFEDDDYYYYVKAVPKIDVTMPEKNVTKFGMEEEEETVATQQEEEVFDFSEEAEKSQTAEPAGETEEEV